MKFYLKMLNMSRKPQQSPININTKNVQECSTLCNLEINYKPIKV